MGGCPTGGSQASFTEEAENGSSKRTSKTKSSRKSKHS